MPTTEIVITSVSPKKSGETNGKGWTLYEVAADTQDGTRKFTSFDSAWGLYIGSKMTVEYEVQRKDKFINYRLGDAPTKAPAPAPVAVPSVAAPKNGTDDKFGQLVHRLDMIYELLKEIRGKFA